MQTTTVKQSILETVAELQNDALLIQIEKLLQEQAADLLYITKARNTENLLKIKQKPRKVKTDLEELAVLQNYAPKKQLLIGALSKDDISFIELTKMIGK